MNPEWSKGLPKAGSNTQVIDVATWMDMLGGMREGASAQELTDAIIKKLGGVKGDMAAVKEALDIFPHLSEQINKAAEKILEAQKNQE